MQRKCTHVSRISKMCRQQSSMYRKVCHAAFEGDCWHYCQNNVMHIMELVLLTVTFGFSLLQPAISWVELMRETTHLFNMYIMLTGCNSKNWLDYWFMVVCDCNLLFVRQEFTFFVVFDVLECANIIRVTCDSGSLYLHVLYWKACTGI